jgi:hypothetical protein
VKDRGLGDKRLISVPDRIRSTLQLNNGRKMFRLTVINAYNSCQLYSMDQNAAAQLAFDLIGPFQRKNIL